MTAVAERVDGRNWTRSELDEIKGCTEPRLWTPPLRELTPATSYGFEVVDFARHVLRHPLDPWEEWTVIHAGELLPDGRPRFRRVLVLVARQNGKTELLVVLTLYWLFVERVSMILGTSTKLDYAAESWRKACKLAKRVPALAAEIPKKGGIRRANGEQVLWRADPDEYELDEGSRYKIAASNEEGGRSLTIARLVWDELRQHHDYSSVDASEPATSAVFDAQIWGLSNAGDDRSVVLNDLRAEALHFIETGEGDDRLGLFEYSSPPKASPVDPYALAQANPNAGRRKSMADLVAAGASALRQGGDKLTGFMTEQMCLWVPKSDPALDMDQWRRPAEEGGCLSPGSLEDLRSRLALCVDVSLDGKHAALFAAAVQDDGRVRVDSVAAWDSTAAMRRELRDLVRRIKPRKFGWFPNGPAASVAAELADGDDWPPNGVDVDEIRSEVAAVCMGMAELVESGDLLHSDDPLLTAQAEAAEPKWTGDRWVFTRQGSGHCNAVYAVAGAVHLARTLPPPVQPSEVY